MHLINLILAQGQPGGSPLGGIFMIVALIVIFYFFMIRPQQKKQKEIKRQREAMTKGDKVITAGGIMGRISAIKEQAFMVEIAPGVDICVDKNYLYPVVDAAPQKSQKTKPSKSEKEVTDIAGEEVENK